MLNMRVEDEDDKESEAGEYDGGVAYNGKHHGKHHGNMASIMANIMDRAKQTAVPARKHLVPTWQASWKLLRPYGGDSWRTWGALRKQQCRTIS